MPERQLLVNFESVEAMLAFGNMIDQKLTPDTKSVWWPKPDMAKATKRYSDKS
jgi:hypothetical protein